MMRTQAQKEWNGKRPPKPKPKPVPASVAAKRRLLAFHAAVNLPPLEKAVLAAEILTDAALCREVFQAFWNALPDCDQEEVGAWIALALDGDEHEADLLN